MDSSKKQFSCANPSKSFKTERKLEQIRMEEDGKLQFNSYRAKPLPKEVMVGILISVTLYGNLFYARHKLFFVRILLSGAALTATILSD